MAIFPSRICPELRDNQPPAMHERRAERLKTARPMPHGGKSRVPEAISRSSVHKAAQAIGLRQDHGRSVGGQHDEDRYADPQEFAVGVGRHREGNREAQCPDDAAGHRLYRWRDDRRVRFRRSLRLFPHQGATAPAKISSTARPERSTATIRPIAALLHQRWAPRELEGQAKRRLASTRRNNSRASTLTRVDLPEPLCPISPVIRPAGNDAVTSCRSLDGPTATETLETENMATSPGGDAGI